MKNLLILLFCSFALNTFALPQDSIGTKIIDGKLYILHKVSKGEGVYAISRMYQVSADDIYAANEGSEKTILIDQVLLIPKGPVSSQTTASKSNSGSQTEKVYHTVSKGQTLSLIARMYNTSVDDIKSLNNLKSDNIQLGQKLLVEEKTIATNVKPKTEAPKTAETPKTAQPDKTEPAKPAVPKTETKAPEPQKNVVVNTSPISNGAVTAKVPSEPVSDQPGTVKASYSTDDGDEISETGMAMISIEGDLNQERSFILHPTAKIGTIVMITNPANNNTVFARVIGNCKAEDGIILKMSKNVATKLGVSENTQVKISYAK